MMPSDDDRMPGFAGSGDFRDTVVGHPSRPAFADPYAAMAASSVQG